MQLRRRPHRLHIRENRLPYKTGTVPELQSVHDVLQSANGLAFLSSATLLCIRCCWWQHVVGAGLHHLQTSQQDLVGGAKRL